MVQPLPIWRLTERSVRSGLVIAWRFATSPIRTSPLLANATTDGVVRAPSAFAMTTGSPPSRTATTELVVPRSIPTALAMMCFSCVLNAVLLITVLSVDYHGVERVVGFRLGTSTPSNAKGGGQMCCGAYVTKRCNQRPLWCIPRKLDNLNLGSILTRSPWPKISQFFRSLTLLSVPRRQTLHRSTTTTSLITDRLPNLS